jgi:hypothetical protein
MNSCIRRMNWSDRPSNSLMPANRASAKDIGNQKGGWLPSDEPNRLQRNSCGQEGYSAEGEGNDEIKKVVGLVCICSLKCGSIGHSNIPLFRGHIEFDALSKTFAGVNLTAKP